MTLLSPLFLLFGLAALVPLVLHLYQRRRRVVVQFSTNRFFTQAIQKSQRRMKLHRLLLLILRMAACIFLALALARPILDLAGLGAAGAGNRDVVLVLDDSLSMRAREGNGASSPSRFVAAKAAAAATLQRLVPGDRAAVVTFTGRVIGQATRGGMELSPHPGEVAADLEKLDATTAAGDAHRAIAQVARMFSHNRQRARLLILLSDFQNSDWRQAQWPSPGGPVGGLLVRLGQPTRDNVVLDQVSLSQQANVVGQPGLLHVRVVNHRPTAAAVQLVLKIDDQEAISRPLDVPGASPLTEHLPVIFKQPGEHRLSLELLHADALPEDNTYFATVLVHPRLPVLLVDGQGEGVRQSPAFFLRAALRATSEDGTSIQADVVGPRDLPSVRLDSYRVVALCDVPELPPAQVERLEKFVQSGAGLAMFLGPTVKADFYNQTLGGPTRPLEGMLPAQVRSLVGGQGQAEPMHILAAELDHPVLQRFKGTMRGALAGVSVYRAHAVLPRQALVVAAMDDGLPLLVERSYGRGKVMLLATSPQPSWTNLPLRGVFLPLASRMMSYLAGGEAADTSFDTGQEMLVARGGGWDYTKPIHVIRPDGQRVQAAIKSMGAEPVAYLAGASVASPGWYRVQSEQTAKGASSGWRSVLAVNAPRSESVPTVLEPAELKKDAQQWRLETVDLPEGGSGRLDPAMMASLIDQSHSSRGVWDALLWVVLALVLIEPMVANALRGMRK